jgi:hypothetical protein
MIVRETPTSFLLITQPDHATLARHLMEPWGALARAARRASILHAIQEHDNGWREPDSAPIVDPATGRILDFVTAPTRVREAVWPRGVARLAEDPWAAALVAQHALTIYERFRTDAEWSAFFSRMTAARDHHLHVAGLAHDALQHDYVFLRIGDLASLTFCNEWTDEQQFDRYAVRLEGSRLVISPDPYDGGALSFEVTARELPRRSYGSDADARAAFLAGRTIRLAGQAVGGPST